MAGVVAFLGSVANWVRTFEDGADDENGGAAPEESPSTLFSGLLLRSVSWSPKEKTSLRMDDEPDDVLLRVDGDFLLPEPEPRQRAVDSSMDLWMASTVTTGESGSRKLRAFGRPRSRPRPR